MTSFMKSRSIIIWRRNVEEEASREEGTDFSKGKNDKQKTTKRRPHFVWSVQIGLKVTSVWLMSHSGKVARSHVQG